MPSLVDSHVHLDDHRFDDDREAVIARARQAGVEAMIVPATHAEGWPAVQRLQQDFPDVFPAYGLHPMFLQQHIAGHVEALDGWLDSHPAVAVGEIGLDYFVEELDRDVQQACFEGQLAVAKNHGLPVIVHARRAVDAVIATLRRYHGVRGVVHSFSGSEEQAHRLLDLEFMLGLGGPVTYPRAQRLRRLAAAVPVEQLLIESDGPDQPGVDHRGQRNEPAWTRDTLRHLADIRGADADELATATTANAERLFGLHAFRPGSAP